MIREIMLFLHANGVGTSRSVRIFKTYGQNTLSDIAVIMHNCLPDAQITFDKLTGGRKSSRNWLIDNTRLALEFGMQCRPVCERVLQIINDCRAELG